MTRFKQLHYILKFQAHASSANFYTYWLNARLEESIAKKRIERVETLISIVFLVF